MIEEAGCAKCKKAPLVIAVKSGLFGLIPRLLSFQNQADENGDTALILVCRLKRYDLIESFMSEAGC